MSFFGGVGERLLADKVESYPKYDKLMAVTKIRNWWDHGDHRTRIFGGVYVDSEIIR